MFLTVLSPTAAHADHAYQLGWWGNPPIVISDGRYTANVQDAAYYWEDAGFNGYYPPLPNVPQPAGAYCTHEYDGYINVCTVPRYVLQPYCSQACDGFTRTNWYIGTNRIKNAWTLISDDLSPYRRQQVWRHEWGHVIGLGHTSYPGCVMNADASAPLGGGCTHDVVTIQNTMYPGDPW